MLHVQVIHHVMQQNPYIAVKPVKRLEYVFVQTYTIGMVQIVSLKKQIVDHAL